MLEIESQNMFELWNYSLSYTSLAVLAVFVVDMIGHRTKTITTSAFTWSSVAGIVSGEFVMTLLEHYGVANAIPFACIASVAIAIVIALTMQTKDPVDENRRRRGRS